jgi:hypothetical protein
MGGVSDGWFRITPDKTLEFSGTLSLENNCGFASVQTNPADFDIKAGDAIVVRTLHAQRKEARHVSDAGRIGEG